ncbi:transcription factor UPBEAT1 [Rhododendron vialii]|uniref:transcription factor UPBEAT1 n=1 Tax=Rhododendron vialii TaxID=182163 RepID=UPI00265F6075|nr:transcription factor UPBEAT1 [Rhododendron vialii]
MGDHDAPQSLLGYQGKGRRWNSNGPLLPSENKVSKAQSTRRWKEISKRPRMILMKRRYVRLQGSTRPAAANVFEKRVRVLRKLVPTKEYSEGLDGLFRDTTDYILALEMRVKVMQIMVKALSGGSDDDE